MQNIVIIDFNDSEQGILQSELRQYGDVSVLKYGLGEFLDPQAIAKIIDADQLIFCVDLTQAISEELQEHIFLKINIMLRFPYHPYFVAINHKAFDIKTFLDNLNTLHNFQEPDLLLCVLNPENPDAEDKKWELRESECTPPIDLSSSFLIKYGRYSTDSTTDQSGNSYGIMGKALGFAETVVPQQTNKPGFSLRFKNALDRHPLMITLSTGLSAVTGAGAVSAAIYFTGFCLSLALGPIPSAIILGVVAFFTVAALVFAASVAIAVAMDWDKTMYVDLDSGSSFDDDDEDLSSEVDESLQVDLLQNPDVSANNDPQTYHTPTPGFM